MLGLICLIPFYQPGCIDSFVLYGIKPSLFSLVGKMFTAMRLLISCGAITVFIIKINEIIRKNSGWLFVIFFVNILTVVISGVVNHARPTTLISYMYDVGLLCIYELLICYSYRSFIKLQTILYGGMSIIGAASVIAFPHGFNHAYDIHRAIYFLGSKNASINVYIIFLMIFFGKHLIESDTLPKRSIFYLAVFMATGLVMQSGSTILCVLGLAAVYVYYGVMNGRIRIPPLLPSGGIAFVITAIYYGTSSPYIVRILTMLGRDLTFSGRTILWRQALRYFKSNVWFGAGMDIVYKNFSGMTQYSAHSQFLDRLAKYGLIQFIVFIGSLVYTVLMLSRSRSTKLSSMLGLLLALYILRMGFDVYSLYYIFTIAYITKLLVHGSEDDNNNVLTRILGVAK